MKRFSIIVVFALLIGFPLPISVCAQSLVPQMTVFDQDGYSGTTGKPPTTRIVTTNSSAKFTTVFEAAYGSTVEWAKVRGMTCTCEDADARVSIGVAAENDATPVGHIIYERASYNPSSNAEIQNAYIISHSTDDPASLQCTLKY